MIENLEEKLSGSIPVNKDELLELISSWGRKENFSIFKNYISSCEPKECYHLENLDA